MKKLINIFPVLAGICWGSAGIFVRGLQAAGLSNLTIIFGRLTMTVIMVGVYMLIKDRKLFYLRKKDIPVVAFTGIIGFSLMNIFYNYSIQYLSLSLAAVLLCTAPVYVIIFGAVVFKEKITPLKILCMFAVLFGCLLMTGVIESGHLQWSLLGIMIGVLCSLSNAVCTLGCNEASGVRGVHPVTLLFYNSLFALLPLTFFMDFGELASFIAPEPVIQRDTYAARFHRHGNSSWIDNSTDKLQTGKAKDNPQRHSIAALEGNNGTEISSSDKKHDREPKGSRP